MVVARLRVVAVGQGRQSGSAVQRVAQLHDDLLHDHQLRWRARWKGVEEAGVIGRWARQRGSSSTSTTATRSGAAQGTT